MINKILGALKRTDTGFDHYASGLLTRRGNVGPTHDEIKRDYSNAVRSAHRLGDRF